MPERSDRSPQTPAAKTAIVTGGAGALGTAIARILVRHAYRVAIVDSQADKAKQVVEQLNGWGGDAVFFEMDVRDASAWESLRTSYSPAGRGWMS